MSKVLSHLRLAEDNLTHNTLFLFIHWSNRLLSSSRASLDARSLRL